MKQTLHFVPVRLAVALALVLAAALYSPANAAVEIILAASQQEQTDPIVTGASSSASELEKWKERQRRFEKCGLCGEEQPFPGNLPE